MNPQISFCISPQKEKEFINFVHTECDCEVLDAWSGMPLCIMEKNGAVSETSKYFLVPRSFIHLVHYTTRQNDTGKDMCYIDPNCTNTELASAGMLQLGLPYRLPYVEYTKTKLGQETMPRCRLWTELTFLLPEHKNVIRRIYMQIKKWIQKHATSKDTSDIFYTIYHVL